jgi:hypothetical protein
VKEEIRLLLHKLDTFEVAQAQRAADRKARLEFNRRKFRDTYAAKRAAAAAAKRADQRQMAKINVLRQEYFTAELLAFQQINPAGQINPAEITSDSVTST